MRVADLIDLQKVDLMIDWCAGVLDTGSRGISESSMTKVATADALFRVADRCVQVMGGTGVSPGGHPKFPHPWPGQIPPVDSGGTVCVYAL